MIDYMRVIHRLKIEKTAVILAHVYQDLQIQAVADVVGDSFEMARQAAMTQADTLVVCGVKFMAESAKILSRHKTVLIPRPDAGCPMADCIQPSDVLALREMHPAAAVMAYVNTSAAVKAVCDVCCTSASAVAVAKKLDADTIVFLPDQNLGAYVAAQVPEKRFVFFDGCCPIHNDVTSVDVESVRARYPGAFLAVHPECRPEVAAIADFVGSTTQIINRVVNGGERDYIIGTETTVVDLLRERAPDKCVYPLSDAMVCTDMRKTTLEDVYRALAHGKYTIELPDGVMDGARRALERMLQLSA